MLKKPVGVRFLTVILALVLATALAQDVSAMKPAATPTPTPLATPYPISAITYITPNVMEIDGHIDDWNLAIDCKAPLYSDGNQNADADIMGFVYFRYDFTNELLYTLVLTNDTVQAIASDAQSWVKLDNTSEPIVQAANGDDGIPSDFVFVRDQQSQSWGRIRGFEACFSLGGGDYLIEVNLLTIFSSEFTTAQPPNKLIAINLPLKIVAPQAIIAPTLIGIITFIIALLAYGKISQLKPTPKSKLLKSEKKHKRAEIDKKYIK